MSIYTRFPAVGPLGNLFGSYDFHLPSNTIAAGLAANSPIFSLRWTRPDAKLVLRNLYVSAQTIVGFTAGICAFRAFIARNFTVSDSGGLSVDVTKNWIVSGSPASGIADMRISDTGALTPGTRTLDPNAFSGFLATAPTAATALIASRNGLRSSFESSKDPIVLGVNEGIVLQATVPATGTWIAEVGMELEVVGL